MVHPLFAVCTKKQLNEAQEIAQQGKWIRLNHAHLMCVSSLINAPYNFYFIYLFIRFLPRLSRQRLLGAAYIS